MVLHHTSEAHAETPLRKEWGDLLEKIKDPDLKEQTLKRLRKIMQLESAEPIPPVPTLSSLPVPIDTDLEKQKQALIERIQSDPKLTPDQKHKAIERLTRQQVAS